eukprot:CAMPEP_0172445542 /NCGR_PEP_ID=MMETSP1065-20121228/5355_1 /TAXON_ID=265537 /ORGANISM="Amphiprora paludosa, Strain CCMP125" /LENGTH=402 /DNA_ID=CAMNT_0013196415 /DNA_START=13 /DNA_END=1221 /DNA_ORIENTATION=+
MDKLFERFKPGAKKKPKSGGGLNFGFSLPGQKFQGEGKSLGGGKPGKVIEIELPEPGSLGIKVEKRPNGTAIVASVLEGSQAEKAGMIRGDIVCFQGSGGQEEVPYALFLELAKAQQRPVCFEVRRVQTKTTASGEGNRSAEAYARQQAVIAAAEKRERAAKAINKKTRPAEKKLPDLLSTEEKRKLEEERLARMDAAVENQSEASKEAAQAAKMNEARTAAQLGYNPYETNKVTAGQARNATTAVAHGAIQNESGATGDMPPLPMVRPPTDPTTVVATPTSKNQTPVSHDFQVAYETAVTANDHDKVVNSFSILRKLIQNAATKGQGADETQAQKFRKVRLGNAKIKAAIVDVEGNFDIMMAVGFQLAEEEGESFLVFPQGFKGEEWLPTALALMEKYEKS